MVTGTSLDEFNAYLTKLTNTGFTKMAENRLAGNAAGTENISTRWLSPNRDYVLTVYYAPDYSEVKIVADTGEDIVKSYAAGFNYEGGEAITSVMMTMYGLSMAPNGYDTTTQKQEYNTNRRNCGAAIVIRMPDNSLFINDGGDLHQWSDEFCAEFMEFCREITGTPAGEKVIINTWFISHAHSDHFEGIPRFFDKYHNEIDIQNVMYSLDNEMIGSSRDMTQVLKMVKAYFPDVKYYKPHTGEHFTINGIEFDVLYTQEDRFLPDADGNLDFGTVSKKTRDNGTYRAFLQEATNATTGAKEYDFNDTSTVLKITFPKEVTGESVDYDSILYADANLADQVMWETLGGDVLATDIMMVPHHGHDAHPELVAMSGANIFLYTQHKQAIYGPDDDYTTVDAAGTYRPNLRNLFLEMQDHGGENYFNTTATRKTYWEGNESAVIFFGEDKAFAEAETLGMSLDAESPTGFTVYTKAAPTFAYGGWTLLSNVLGTDYAQTDSVDTKTTTIRANAVEVDNDGKENDILTPGSKYIIVHNKTNQVMYYKAGNGTEDPARPSSLIAGTRPNVDDGTADIYFRYISKTETNDDKLYFTQHMRDGLLWTFSLDDMFDLDTTVDQVVHNASTPRFGGVSEEHFYRSYWLKGLSSEEVYWETDPANAQSAWRVMIPGNSSLIRNFSSNPTYNTRIEFFVNDATTDVDGDGIIDQCDTCVIYYHNNTTLDDFRFLTVDEAGNWIQKTYNSIEAATADLENLKLRLYEYKELPEIKTVDSVGPQTYYATVGTDKQELIDSITYQLTVRDSYRRWIPIPCSGQTAVAGYYWLDGSLDTSAVKQSAIAVKYRNDDGTDTLVTTLNLHVCNEVVTEKLLASEGIAATNASTAGNVFESRSDAGVVTDRTMTLVVSTKDGYVRKDVSVNVGMLSYDADSTVTAPDGTAVSTGNAGAMVNTNVEEGTVYSGLTLSYSGMVITEDFTLTIEEISQLDQPEYPDAGSVQVDKLGTPAGSSFFNTGIADIQLSATGISDTTGVDLIMVLDMSGSMSDAVSTSDSTARLDALKSSMKSLMETLQQSDVDFRVAISDFGDLDHFMFDGAVVDDSIRDTQFFDANGSTDWNDSASAAFGTSYEFYNHLNYVFSKYGVDIYQRGTEILTGPQYATHIKSFTEAEEAKWTKSATANAAGKYTYTNTDGSTQLWTESEYSAYIKSVRAAEEKTWTRIEDNDNQAEPFERTITKWCEVHNLYTGSAEPNVYTGSGKANAEAFVNVKSKTSTQWDALIDGFRQGGYNPETGKGYWYGTNYDRGLEYMYQLGYAIQQDNINKGLDREVVAVFMSDGAPMQYNYFSGRTTSPSWPAWFTGEIDADKLQTTPFSMENKPQSVVTLEENLLAALKINGELLNPDYIVYAASNAETLQNEAGFTIINTNNDEVLPVATAGDLNTQIPRADVDNAAGWNGYFYLQIPTKTEADLQTEPALTFYEVMLDNGIRMDEDLMNRIAKVNGIECDVANMTQEQIKDVDAQLLKLALDGTGGKVKYPTTAKRWLYNKDATDLYADIGALLGYELTWDKLLQIAYRSNNIDLNGDGTNDVSLRDLLVAAMTEVTTLGDGYEWGTLSPYSYFYNEEGKNWWAEAIKGDTDKLYPVINKYAYEDHVSGAYSYYGSVRNHYDSGTGTAWDGQDYIAGYRGLGIPIYTLGVSIGGIGYISNEDTVNVLKNISSGETYAFSAYSGDDLNKVFATITASATNAATRAWFTDTMGDNYDLLTTPTNGVTPTIEVREYQLDANHNRTGDFNVLESVTFEGNGVAKSTAVFDSVTDENEVPIVSYPDIWLDNGVIDGKYFYYNTNTAGTNVDLNNNGALALEEGDVVDGSVRLDLSGDGVLDYTLAPETFFWILGTISTTELVLDYQVYLTGSDPDDPAEQPGAGDYPTNKSAVLHYINYRSRNVEQPTVSPEFPWGKARVGYGFYLVDEEGKPIVNIFTGETGSIQNAVKLTKPAYQDVTWNEELWENKITSASKASAIPNGYSLYVSNVSYFVAANSDGSGQWNFQSDATGTTYVQYGSTYTNETVSDDLGLNEGQIHDTIVWFAVRAKDGTLNTDKTVEKDGDNFKLTLEAFATGETSQISEVAPADIVLVLDQSSSMYTPLGWNKDRVIIKSDTYTTVNSNLSSYKITDFVSQAKADTSEIRENAKRMGYYIAVHNEGNYMYLVHYAQNSNKEWGWYYISLDQTVRSIDMDTIKEQYDNPSGDSTLATNEHYKTIVYNNGYYDLLTNVSYYKTQYGALVESVESFVEGLQGSGVNHRVGIVGFASPFYDGWEHYDGSGLYVDGNFYLYDTDFMYKGSYDSSNKLVSGLRSDGVDFVEEDWSGSVVLDPNKTFASSDSAASALDPDIVGNAYENSIILKDATGTPTGGTMYGQALADVSTESGYASIQKSIAKINANYQQTCPSVGIEMAEKIFEARTTGTERDKIIVLFTDGVPTVRLLTNRHHGFTDDVFADALYWSIGGGVEDALDRASIAKNNDVIIYTVGTASMKNTTILGTNIHSGDFLNYLSSNYTNVEYGDPPVEYKDIPNNSELTGFIMNGFYEGGEGPYLDPDHSHTKYGIGSDRGRQYAYYDATKSTSTADALVYYYSVTPKDAAAEQSYAQFATSGSTTAGSDLHVAFGTIMNAITVPTVKLDGADILKDVLSDYFELVGGNQAEIEVYTATFNADGTVNTPVPFDATIEITKSDPNSDRYDVINVSGYDYSTEYYSKVARTKDGADYYGSKLIVKIPIMAREGFWGGNNVPTNEVESGVYDDGTELVQDFPVPEANVPVKPVITAKDQVVYYGDTVIDAMDLIDSIAVGGKNVTYNETTGAFEPLEDWMDDYAELNWSVGMNMSYPDTAVSSTKSGSYTFGVTLTPRPVDEETPRTGEYNMTEVSDNIAGTAFNSISADPATGNVDILVPVLTYQDSNIQLGEETTGPYYASTNLAAGVQWVNMDDPYGLDKTNYSTTPSDFSVEPTLTRTYTPVGKFSEDTAVDVEVYRGSEVSASAKITDVTYFAWVSCSSDLHEFYETPADDKSGDSLHWHKGSTVSHEFYIHVIGGDNGMVTNKFASLIDGTTDQFKLTLEAYATGSESTINFTKPADIVLVLDHSGSMRTPVGATNVLDSGEPAPSNITPISRSKLSVAKAKHIGYYVAQDTSDNYWYIMEHRDDLVVDGVTVSGWRGYKVHDTEAIINPGVPSDNGYNQFAEVDWKGGTVPETLVFYKSQYAMLYDSVLNFVSNLKKSGVEHNVSIVGFAGSTTFGTRLYCGFTKTDANGATYIDETVKKYETILNDATAERQNELYVNAMKNVQDATEYAELLSNIEAIETNYSFTCPAAGLDLANKVMQANPVNPLDRDRIVVLFTDGIPNRKIGENDTGSDLEAIYEQVVGMASYTKKGYNAQVYSISTSTLGSGDRTFLHYLSSDYPDAVSYTYPGDEIDEPKYTMEVNSLDGLEDAFDNVTKEVSSTTVPLDDTTVLMEILTDYVEFENPETAVVVYKQLYNGDGTWGQRIQLVNTDEHTYYELASTDGTRTDIVKVFGFHYSTEYISDVARTVDGADYYGSKLVAEVTVKARKGFWGGNNVPTNDPATGLYSDNERVEAFPIPEVNVPITPNITIKDQVVYYGEDGINAGHLFQVVTVNGVDVLYDKETGKFLPPEGMEWVDDYADLSWVTGEGYSNLDTEISGTESGDYTFGVVMKPKYDGSANMSDNPGNLMGTAVPKDGITVTDTASVDVLVPMITFKDSTIALGDQVNKEYYDTTNLVSGITWVNKDDPYGINPDAYPTVPSEGFNTAPDLTLSYTPVNGEGEYFTEDFKVNVEVSVGENSITDESYFKWADCDNGKLHDMDEIPTSDRNGGSVIHKGTTDSHEFTVHVTYVLVEDMVVIDFGIPVDISALLNDNLPEGATVEALMLGNELPGIFTTTLGDKFSTSASCDFGALSVGSDGKLRYTSSNMQMKQSVKFIYAVKYTNGETVRYYYSSVTVIPATTIYYEDSFVTFDVVDSAGNKIEGTWTPVTDANNKDTVQDEDRPAVDENDALGSLDMDSIYGFDTHYTGMTQYSLGSAMKIKVTSGKAGKASFSFWGTGFDVVSLSSNETGVIVVKITDADGKTVANYLVDTYYGYKFADTDEDGVADAWIVDEDAANALYQVPVIKVDLDNVVKTEDNANTTDVDETEYFGYGYYNVEIVASYGKLFDHKQCSCDASLGCTGCYDFYLDAIRIYDPANDGADDDVVEDAYIADGEYLPTYEELRNLLIGLEDFNSLGDKETAGVVFIDGNAGLSADSGNGGSDAIEGLTKPGVTEYANYGPNNELYLAKDQAVAFLLNDLENLSQVHLALKSVGSAAEITIYGVDETGAITYILNDRQINSATDLYYNITDLVGKTVVIRNSGESGMLSITNLKSTYLASGSGGSGYSLASVTTEGVNLALTSLEGEKDPIVAEGTIAPEYATLTYEDEILLNIHFQLSGLDVSLENLGLMTYTADGNTLLDTIPGAVYTDGSYVVSTNPIAPKNLGDTVWFRVYAKLADGSYVYSNLLSYSPKTYATNILNNSENAEMKALVVSMLNYGAAAQEYFGYKTDALVNADLTAEQKALVSDYSADMIAPVGKVDSSKVGAFAANGGFGVKYPTVSLEGAFAINYYLETSYAMDGALTLYYWNAEDYANADILTAENATGVLVDSTTVEGIAAKDLDSTIYVAAVYESEGASYCSGVLAYSVGAYCAGKADSSALAQAIAVYGYYAKAYFG